MYCSKCGAQLPDGSAFCPKCGAAQAAPAAPVDATQPATPVEPAQVTPAAAQAQYVPAPEPVAQPAQATPQPVSATPPTSGASQQTYQQPSQPSYAYQAVPAAAPKKKSPLPAIIGAVAAIAVVGAVGMHFLGGGSDPEPAPSAPEAATTEPEATEPEATAPEAISSADYLDSHGNPTTRAVSDLSGADLVALVEGEGWEWSEDKLWFVSSTHDYLYVFGPENYEYTYDDTVGLGQFGGSEPVTYLVELDDEHYSSLEDAIDSLITHEITDIRWNDDMTTALVSVKGSSTGDFIVFAYVKEDYGLYSLRIFSPAAIEQGEFNAWVGEEAGTSVDEIWSNLFG